LLDLVSSVVEVFALRFDLCGSIAESVEEWLGGSICGGGCTIDFLRGGMSGGGVTVEFWPLGTRHDRRLGREGGDGGELNAVV
jgi:hypothetical protein